MSYFCKECLERHQVASKLYRKHKAFAFNDTSGQMPETSLKMIFRLNKILEDNDLLKKLLK